MASNRFGQVFCITTWGESHGPAIGVVIDGCPAGLALDEKDIQLALDLRAPGQSIYTTPRREPDRAHVYSGVFEGKTTGTPISIVIYNQDADATQYDAVKDVFRPGHANFTYLHKYGAFDHRGGGRASARETACRVAAGAVAKQLLRVHNVEVVAYLGEMGGVAMAPQVAPIQTLQRLTQASPIRCPDEHISAAWVSLIEETKAHGDSLGGVVHFLAEGLPIGLGDPIYEKLEANLAKAMMSLPASKGIELGEGFQAARLSGSSHNDAFISTCTGIQTQTNHAGGTLGGMSTGMPLYGRVAFKPTSSIQQQQQTCSLTGESVQFKLPESARHDPCVAIRAVPVVESMCALVLADALLMNRISKL